MRKTLKEEIGDAVLAWTMSGEPINNLVEMIMILIEVHYRRVRDDKANSNDN